MNRLPLPVVPESLRPFADDNFFEVADKYAHLTIDKVVSTMPDTQTFGRYNNYPAMDVVVMRPKDFEPKEAVFLPYPFGNGHAPHMHIRAAVMQEVLGNDKQVVCFPNNTTRQKYYSLTTEQADRIASGDATPIAAGMLAVARELGIEYVDIINYSQPNLISPALVKLAARDGRVQVDHVLFAEMANGVQRTEKQLERAVRGTGLFKLIRAVRDSAIPALTEAQNMRGIRDYGRLARGFLGAAKGAKLYENAVLHQGMARDSFFGDLEEMRSVSPRTLVTLMRAEYSKIVPASDMFTSAATRLSDQFFVVEGYGHEAADNVTGVHALLSKAAIKGLTT